MGWGAKQCYVPSLKANRLIGIKKLFMDYMDSDKRISDINWINQSRKSKYKWLSRIIKMCTCECEKVCLKI